MLEVPAHHDPVIRGAGFPEAGPMLREAFKVPSGPREAGSQELVNYFSLPAPRPK